MGYWLENRDLENGPYRMDKVANGALQMEFVIRLNEPFSNENEAKTNGGQQATWLMTNFIGPPVVLPKI